MAAVPEYDLLSVSDCRRLLEDTLAMAVPAVMVQGEVSDFSVNRETFVFFDLKDKTASLRCFMMRHDVRQPIENGMTLRMVGRPHITAKGQLSLTVEAYQLVGEGSLARAFALLQQQLTTEGLFAAGRKRPLPIAPTRIGLVASRESAAYGDFMKILGHRWAGVEIIHCDTHVQGVHAEKDVVRAIAALNQLPEPPEVIVITRGGGSAEDLAAFSTELVVRAVAASRVPTLVAIGHEQDVSLAELAADVRASTPSNAAELLTPDRTQVLRQLAQEKRHLIQYMQQNVEAHRHALRLLRRDLLVAPGQAYEKAVRDVQSASRLLFSLSPMATLRRGYAVVRSQGNVVHSVSTVRSGTSIDIMFADGTVQAEVQ